jgi:hypothetical protein
MLHQADIDTRTVLAIAVEADVDPRSVRHEIAAMRGERPHVRGRPGERLRKAFAARNLLPLAQAS